MATNMYIKFEEPAIKGESSESNHADQIEILSWSHGFNQPTSPVRSTAGAGTVEQANHQNFNFTKYLDSATDDLIKMCWSGKQIGKATVECYRAQDESAAEMYLQIEMQHVIISNYSVGGSPGDVPVENISLDYGIVKYNYAAQKKDDGTGEGAQPIEHNLETRVIA